MNTRWCFFWYFLGVWSTIWGYLGFQAWQDEATHSSMALYTTFFYSWSVFGAVSIPAVWCVFRYMFKGDMPDAHDPHI
jgi:hypothetical protein